MDDKVFIDINTKKWLTNNELKAYLGFGSDSLFRNWRDQGLLPYHKLGGSILYLRKDIDYIISKNRIELSFFHEKK
jgi:hypothetical protein